MERVNEAINRMQRALESVLNLEELKRSAMELACAIGAYEREKDIENEVSKRVASAQQMFGPNNIQPFV